MNQLKIFIKICFIIFSLGIKVLAAPVSTGEQACQEEGHINAWLFLGPFNNTDNQGMSKLWINEISPVPALGKAEKGFVWRYFDDRLFSRNYDNYQDIFSFLCVKGDDTPAAFVAYLHAWVWSPMAMTVSFRAGANQYFAS